ELVGCPDPEPAFRRFFAPAQDALPADLDEIGSRYVGALAREVEAWVRVLPTEAPIGVCFSGGIDSGAVFLVLEHVLAALDLGPHGVGGPPAGARAPAVRAAAPPIGGGARAGLFPGADRGRSGVARSERSRSRHRGLQASRRRVRDDGDRPLPGHPAALPGL